MKRRNNIIKDGKQSQCTDKGKVLGLTINRRGIEPHIKEIKIKALGALTDLYHFKNLQTNMNLHLIKIQDNTDSVIPTDTTLVTISKTNILKLQKVLNAALRFAFYETYSHLRNKTNARRSKHSTSELPSIQ